MTDTTCTELLGLLSQLANLISEHRLVAAEALADILNTRLRVELMQA